ncbi:hypothetical protein EV174_006422, partial [Coemansia sp. RSA 2320]
MSGAAQGAKPISIRVHEESFVDPVSQPASLDNIITCLIHTGHLTIAPNRTIRIPNGELRDAWKRIELLASFDMGDEQIQMRM